MIERRATLPPPRGIEPLDVDVPKLLYLIRYVPHDARQPDNLVILMADNINVDPISMRKTVAESLNWLFQNYIGRSEILITS